MKRNHFKQLALMGLASGLLFSNETFAKNKQSVPIQSEDAEETGNLGYHVLTEDELLLELNSHGKKLYESLDSKGKALARLVASQRCNGTNECKGLNACRTDSNPCAGQGSCKHKGKCGFSDKNLAVEVVYNKLKHKREAMMQH